ncbi:MAG: hypothetical protein ACXU8N_20700 [Telluria sp.]
MRKLASFAGLALLAACHHGAPDAGMRQTKYPGMVTAGGGTSGEVIAASKKAVDSSYAGGTPFHGGGMEGNTGGAKMGGTVTESGHGPSGNTAPPAAKTTPSGQ